VEVNKLYDIAIFDEMGYFWSTAFYLREWIPDTLKWMYLHQPFGYFLQQYDTLGAFLKPMIEDANYKPPLLEYDCAQLLILDLSIPVVGILVCMLVLPRVIIFAWMILSNIVIFVINVFTVLYTMIITIDKQTIKR
tara:strand:- start:154 stop:561 length:408 start_codon:yes stop_codon:yes gene_type:complete